MGIEEGIYGFRHATYYYVLEEKVGHSPVDGFRYRSLGFKSLFEGIDYLDGNAVCPKEFFEIQ